MQRLRVIMISYTSTFFLICYSIIPLVLPTTVDSRCTAQFCEDYKASGKCRFYNNFCKNNPDSTRFDYPDTCNCCDYCLKNLKKGDICVIGQPGANSPLEMCGPGLQCVMHAQGNATCQRINSECTRAQDAYDERQKLGYGGMLEVRPECDGDGFYKPAHCIPGSICYCRAPTGERIFGEIPYLYPDDEDKMTCGCSLNAWKAQNTLDPEHEIIAARCTELGTFDQLQCMMGPDAICLCVSPDVGSPMDTDIVTEENIREYNPPCFDSTRHTAGKYATPCETERESYLAHKDDENTLINDFEETEPFCQPDGKFERLQFSGSKKVCVDPDGRQIDRYEAETSTAEATNMDCNCARTRWLLNSAGVIELPTCCPNGNFEAWQCRRNECFCVDNDGNQIGVEVSYKELFKLACYNDGKPC